MRSRRGAVTALVVLVAAAVGATGASAYVTRGPHGRLYGMFFKPNVHTYHGHVIRASKGGVRYWGGSVMLSTKLHLIFWGPQGSFAPSYSGSIAQWAQDLAADSGKTTNEYSVASLYYRNHPRKQISRTISFGGAVSDTRQYPANGCLNPDNQDGVCLSDAQLQHEVAWVVKAMHWPKDRPGDPRNQYLLFTPAGVDSCEDSTETSCTFASKDGYCAYHSSIALGRYAVVYANMPYLPGCNSGQRPAGTYGNADADGTLDSAIHEVLEAATDPMTNGNNDYGWTDNQSNEIGDLCSPPDGSIYGDPLGGSLDAKTAFNQVINGHTYYTQAIWANATRWTYPGCVQRTGPTPTFSAPDATAGSPVTFDGGDSFDLTGDITTYVWNFGDGSAPAVSHSPQSVHVYAQPGTYQVSLGVADASGARNASVQTQTEVVR